MSQNNSLLRFKSKQSDPTGEQCTTCGELFRIPLLVTMFQKSETEEYYACPKCLSKVANLQVIPDSKKVEILEDRSSKHEKTFIPIGKKIEKPDKCTHQLGYLKNRAKNEPIPEECLTCSKMIECMY